MRTRLILLVIFAFSAAGTTVFCSTRMAVNTTCIAPGFLGHKFVSCGGPE